MLCGTELVNNYCYYYYYWLTVCVFLQDTVQRYGFSSHDGVGYAVQPIEDAQNGVSLITSFVKPVDERDSSSAERGSWAVSETKTK